MKVIEGAAPPEGGSVALRLVMELHRNPDDVMALLFEQGGRDAGIDASGHGYYNTHRRSLSAMSGSAPPRFELLDVEARFFS
jgi:hypothetical protein